MVVGDSIKYMVTSTQTIQPPAGTTWRFENLRGSTDASSTITVNLTDGTNSIILFEAGASCDISWGRCGSYSGTATNTPFAKLGNINYSGGTMSRGIHTHNGLYLTFTVTGTGAACFVEYTSTAESNKGIAIGKGFMLHSATGTQNYQPAVGINSRLVGMFTWAEGATQYAKVELTDATDVIRLMQSSGSGTGTSSSSYITAYSSGVGTFGSFHYYGDANYTFAAVKLHPEGGLGAAYHNHNYGSASATASTALTASVNSLTNYSISLDNSYYIILTTNGANTCAAVDVIDVP